MSDTFHPQRIAWVIYGALEQVTGGYIYDRLVVERLRELGDQVTVVSLTPGAPLPELDAAAYDAVVGDELCFRDLLPLFQQVPTLRRVLLIIILRLGNIRSGSSETRSRRSKRPPSTRPTPAWPPAT